MSYLNDPRVLFAAERTLLAWNRTSIAVMGFGFVIERFGLFMQLIAARVPEKIERGPSFWIGLVFIVLGSIIALASAVQYEETLKKLGPEEIPDGYRLHMPTALNVTVAVAGAALLVYLFVS